MRGKGHISPRPAFFYTKNHTHDRFMKRQLAILLLALLLPIAAGAQVRLSVDVESVQMADGKKITTERSICLHPDGRMIVEQRRPSHNITITNTLGEMRIYTPKTNDVAVINDKDLASSKDIIAMFASGGYVDMGLPMYGYTQSSIRNEGGMIIKSYTPESVSATALVELVFQNHLPICMVYYNAKGEAMRKLYFSRYQYDRLPIPMRITEVEYTPKRDSLVRLSTYSNLCFDGEAQSPLFDFQIPTDAKHTTIDPSKLLQ